MLKVIRRDLFASESLLRKRILRNYMLSKSTFIPLALAWLCLFSQAAFSIGGKGPLELSKEGVKNEKPHYLDEIGIEENLGGQIDLALPFKDAKGNTVQLGKYFQEKPVFLMLIYYNCPTLCNLHFSALMDSFRKFDWNIGEKFEFVAVSIDPEEKPKDAKAKRDLYLSEYGRPQTKKGWHFLTGSEGNIRKLASQIGFKYVWDPNMNQWSHAAAAYSLTPKGRISYYHYGLNIDPKVLRLSLVEASDNKIGNIVDRLVLFCLQYDPKKKTYAFYAYNIMRVAASLAALVLIVFIFKFWRRESGNEV